MTAAERRERQRAERHQLIITAARELAEAEGWEAVTTRKLADRVEYSQPVLYGHFANMERLSKAGKLAVAGPFGRNDDGWRGLYVFPVADVEEARALVATDPVVAKGEMVPEFHPWYGTAALMTVPETHTRLVTGGR